MAELEAAKSGLDAERAVLRRERATAYDTRSRLRRGKYYDHTLTAYAECVTSELTIHDAMLAHETSDASLLWSGMCPGRLRGVRSPGVMMSANGSRPCGSGWRWTCRLRRVPIHQLKPRHH